MSKKYILKPRINDSGFPQSSKFYWNAHSEADNAEKRNFPKSYKDMKKIDANLGKHELSGKNLKSGKILISEKVPKKDRKDVYLHEKTESEAIKRMTRKSRSKNR